jgi:hypothetical protein
VNGTNVSLITFGVVVAFLVFVYLCRRLYQGYDRWWFARHGKQAQGKVISAGERRQRTWGSGGPLGTVTWSTPEVQYTIEDGRSFTTETPTSLGVEFAQGDIVTVTYDPAKPRRARILSSQTPP